jgi:hypothetical protein
MDNITAVRQLISSVHHKIQDEIELFQDALKSIDHHSGDPADQWAHGMYTRLIERRRKMLDRLTSQVEMA